MKNTLAPAAAAAALLAAAGLVQAQVSQYSMDSEDAIKESAAQVAYDMVRYYHGNETGATPGILPGPPPAGDYYWWEGGAMWGTLIEYWAYTGDSTYNDITMQSMQFQVGENKAYMPHNFTASLGNDDQGFWGMSAMLAAELKFPDPASDKPSWLALAQAVFNTQASPDRHDNKCGGGLRWQIPFANNGYNYKNSIANGIFFNLGARLHRYTGNTTYSDWAEKTISWMEDIGFIDAETGAVYDGGHVEEECKDINKIEFSYNNAVLVLGCAFMYNVTEDQKWEKRLNLLLNHGLETFFKNDAAYEFACEGVQTCTTDMLSFKGYLHRWYATTAQLAPFTAEKIRPALQKSTAAAIKQCTGGDFGRQCGFEWYQGKYVEPPGTGAGQQMNVLAALSTQLEGRAPVTAKTGGTSKGDPHAGDGMSDDLNDEPKPITMADRAGAGILTFLLLGSACGMFGWMSIGV